MLKQTLVLLALSASACGPAATSTPVPQAEIANPASVYCEANAGRLELRTAADGGVTGFCVFPDGTECEEWAFFRGECKPPAAASTPTPESSVATIEPVLLQVLLPEDGSVVELDECQVIGTTSPNAVVTINDEIVLADATGAFQTSVHLEPGINLLEVVASNSAGSEAFVNLIVTYEP